MEDTTNPINHQPVTPEVQDKSDARAAYLGYAALANLSNESIEQGLGLVEIANGDQTERIRAAFASVASVLMEVRGLVEIPLAIELPSERVVQTEIVGYQADALGRMLPKIARNYLGVIAGDVSDMQLNLSHVPVIVETLLDMRGPAENPARPPVDMQEMLTLRFAGLTAEEIALKINSTASRVKGYFFRFTEAINQRSSVEDRNIQLRRSLGWHEPDVEVQSLIEEVVDTVVEPIVEEVVVEAAVTPNAFPSDLLPGETMAERRVRLRELAGNDK